MHVLEVSYFIWKRKSVNYKLDLGGILMATSYNVASEKTNLQEIGFHRSNIYYLQNLSQTVLMGGKFGLQEEFFLQISWFCCMISLKPVTFNFTE